ncbi:hypothetical protein EXT51_03190 [Pectobacterium carotovorum subsp. carotovorum]|uniref:Uncharacterized protein n=1 Tax=Pectobacterium brasiliense TaxID=180957 RepID=A0A0M2F350_9GAMM|nr:hypothetical protein [Pectobacterium carotovorum]KGA34231.1 hypothetical protein KU74_12190 [Pectobacterium brasiliense]MCL6328507.1 hypothetical protein [Pectobacterium carotovorum subsp. carotovorum]
MAFIRITNDDRVTLIDSEVFNLTLSEKGGLSFVWTSDDGWHASIVYTAKSELPPLIALSCSTHHISLLSTKKTGNVYTFVIIAIGALGQNPNFSANYFIFDSGELTIEGTGNLIIRNKDGYVTFDSDKKYLTVHSLQTFPSFNYRDWRDPFPSNVIIETPLERKYATVVNKIGYLYVEQSTSGEVDLTWYYDGIRVSPGSISRSFDMFDSRNYNTMGANFTRNSTDSQYMIVDVTGF